MYQLESECEGGCSECMHLGRECESCIMTAQDECYQHSVEVAYLSRPGLAKTKSVAPVAEVEEVAF